MKPVAQVKEDETDAQMQEHANKMALRQWTRNVHLLATALEKIVVLAQENQRLPDDVAERYAMSCTLLAMQSAHVQRPDYVRSARRSTVSRRPHLIWKLQNSGKKKDERKTQTKIPEAASATRLGLFIFVVGLL